MRRKQGVILSYVLMIFEVLSTLLLTPFLIRTLGQAEYGVYKLSVSITAYLMLLDLGVGNAIIRYIAKFRANEDSESENNFFGIATLFYFGIAVISVLCGMVLVLLFPKLFSTGLTQEEILLGQKLLILTVANVAVTLLTTVSTNAIIAYERFAISKGLPIIQIILRMILTIVVLKSNLGSIGIVFVNLVLTIICRGFFTAYVFFALKIRPKLKNIRIEFVKDIFAYSSWILLQMIATQINASMDQILLGTLVSSSATIIAVYSVGIQIVQYFQSIGHSFTGVLMPGVVKLVEKDCSPKTICDEMVRIGRIILLSLGLIWSGFVALGRQFVEMWAGEVNGDSYFIALILMSAYLIILTESVGTQVLWAKNEHKEQAILKIAIVLLNIILTVLLIKWNPLIGATIGTFISLILGDVIVMNIVFAKKLKISLAQYYSKLFSGLLICILLTAGFGFVINLIPIYGWGGLVLKIVSVCLVYIALLILFGMNKYEKNLFASLFRIKKCRNEID